MTTRDPFPLPLVRPASRSSAASAYTRQAYADFFVFQTPQAQKKMGSWSSTQWQTSGEQYALKVFHAAAQRVPAYRDFLKKHRIKHTQIKTIDDFHYVPVMDKKNYLRHYPPSAICWEGTFTAADIVSISSGSSGKPFLWPREVHLEMETTYLFELLLLSLFNVARKKTLVVDCFAMGMYVGGPFFLNALLRIAQKGWPVTVVTPGNVMPDILRLVKELMPQYEQVILSGYPPFLRNVIEEGGTQGINWKKINTKLFPAGEGFSEEWRDIVSQLTTDTPEIPSIFGYYGTADAAVLGFETPWTISVRKALVAQGNTRDIFGDTRLPFIMQYLPTRRYFEALQGELHFTTANGTIPLIRYNIGDQGGIRHSDALEPLVSKRPQWQLPCVYLFGRSDQTAIVYGANVYPEHVKKALEERSIRDQCSGRFAMEVVADSNQYQRFTIHVECAPRVKKTKKLKDQLATMIMITLQEINAEFADVVRAVGERAKPTIHIYSHGSSAYFERQKKQQWVLPSLS